MLNVMRFTNLKFGSFSESYDGEDDVIIIALNDTIAMTVHSQAATIIKKDRKIEGCDPR